VWREWALVAVLVPLAIVEVLVRPDLPWRPLALVLGAAPVFTLRWRRSNPLLVIAVAFGAQAVADVANLYGAHQSAATGLTEAARTRTKTPSSGTTGVSISATFNRSAGQGLSLRTAFISTQFKLNGGYWSVISVNA
jgi:hypothetical protein